MSSKPIIAIIGATGVQGGSVVNAFLATGNYHVRGITRNASSSRATALAEKGVEVVTADLNSEASLVKAFHGATIIFAVTDFFEPFINGGASNALAVEPTQGINLARAAASTPTLKHYIWSTLPNAAQITNGKYVIPHFETKNKVDAFIAADANLLAKTTFFWITWFAANYTFPVFRPALHKPSGKHIFIQPSAPSTPILSIGSAPSNIGAFALATAQKPHLTLPAKTVLAYVETTTSVELLQTWSEVTGKPVEYVQTDEKTYERLFPGGWGAEMGSMMAFWGGV